MATSLYGSNYIFYFVTALRNYIFVYTNLSYNYHDVTVNLSQKINENSGDVHRKLQNMFKRENVIIFLIRINFSCMNNNEKQIYIEPGSSLINITYSRTLCRSLYNARLLLKVMQPYHHAISLIEILIDAQA